MREFELNLVVVSFLRQFFRSSSGIVVIGFSPVFRIGICSGLFTLQQFAGCLNCGTVSVDKMSKLELECVYPFSKLRRVDYS